MAAYPFGKRYWIGERRSQANRRWSIGSFSKALFCNDYFSLCKSIYCDRPRASLLDICAGVLIPVSHTLSSGARDANAFKIFNFLSFADYIIDEAEIMDNDGGFSIGINNDEVLF